MCLLYAITVCFIWTLMVSVNSVNWQLYANVKCAWINAQRTHSLQIIKERCLLLSHSADSIFSNFTHMMKLCIYACTTCSDLAVSHYCDCVVFCCISTLSVPNLTISQRVYVVITTLLVSLGRVAVLRIRRCGLLLQTE